MFKSFKRVCFKPLVYIISSFRETYVLTLQSNGVDRWLDLASSSTSVSEGYPKNKKHTVGISVGCVLVGLKRIFEYIRMKYRNTFSTVFSFTWNKVSRIGVCFSKTFYGFHRSHVSSPQAPKGVCTLYLADLLQWSWSRAGRGGCSCWPTMREKKNN